MNSITSELRSLLLEKGVECSAVMQREEQNQELVMKNSRLCSAATTTVTRVEIRICCSGLYAKKEYTLGADADLSQIATDIISELSERESVFNESPEKDNAAIYEICGEPSTAAMVNTLKKLDHDAKHLGLIIPRAALTYTSISAELENEIGTRIASRQNGYSISYSAFLERDGKTVTPIKVRKTFKILEQFPEIPYSSVLVKNRELLFSKTQIKRFTGSLIIAPGTLYYMMLDFLFEQLFEDAIATGSSDWVNCMDKQVLPPNISAYMDPFHEYCTFGERIRSDGTLSKPYCLVEDGVLKSFIVTPQSAAQLSLAPCGNDGDNLVMPAGKASLEQMISETEKGVVIFSFAGSGSGGEFSGTSLEALYIENGNIISALDNPELCGNWRDIFAANQFDFSSDRESDGEYLLPYLRIKNFSF